MEDFTDEEWDQFQAWRASQERPHVTFADDEDDDDDYDDDYEEPVVRPRPRAPAIKQASPIGYNTWKQTHGAPTPLFAQIPPKRRVQRPKPAFNGRTFTLPEGGTKSQRKIFQTSILKEAYKLVQDKDPRLRGKAGSKLRLKICNNALKEFKSVYEDPNFLYFIQDPQSCQSLIRDFAAELEAQLEYA